MNARFWVGWNGSAVKITLKPGQRLSVYKYRRHEEGWSTLAIAWEYFPGRVWETETSDGVDCDGRLREDLDRACYLEELQAGPDPENDPKVRWPAWSRVSGSSRDYQAEEAGY